MQPAEIDLKIFQGATFSKRFVWKQNDVVVNLAGYTARMQIRESADATTIIASLTTENSGITITAASGQIDLSISATDTAAMNFRQAVYDLELVSGSTVVKFCKGSVTLEKEVTK